MTTVHFTRTIVDRGGKGFVELALAEVALPRAAELRDSQVLIAIEAAPINPSDIGPIFAPSYGGIGRFDGLQLSTDAAGRAVVALPIADKTFARMAGGKLVGRVERRGNEGAGRVVAAGRGAAAQALVGRLVACIGTRSTYGQHAVCEAASCIAHEEGTSAEEAASSWVNPLTALGMIKTMRAEGHTGLVHTAAASQLGQMLVKICKADGIPLVNVVRRPAQVALLRAAGAEHVVDTSAAGYQKDLVAAMAASGATMCFDALGGGTTGFEIIKAMESAAQARGGKANNYGSSTFKKLYVYGGLNAGEPMVLKPHAGMGGFSWAVAGFILDEGTAGITEDDKRRVAREIKTTFATTYSRRITLEQMLQPDVMAEYQKQQSNNKALVMPHAGGGGGGGGASAKL